MIYLDHNSTSKIDPTVLASMMPFLTDQYGNPSSPYTFARTPALAVQAAREKVASLFDVRADAVVFTSGGTESNNLALLGSAPRTKHQNEILIGATEHPSVIDVSPRLREQGYRVTMLPVDRKGLIDLDKLDDILSERTALVAVMAANNETGVIQPIHSVLSIMHNYDAPLHVDCAQIMGRLPTINFLSGASTITLSAHKAHGPKGAGALLVGSRGGDVHPVFSGGGQEHGLRPGTENVAGIVGLEAAFSLAQERCAVDAEVMQQRRDRLEGHITAHLDGVRIAGAEVERLPNTSMLLIDGCSTEAVIAALDMEDICCSSGSACASGSPEPSRVLQAMGWTTEELKKMATIRISIGRDTTDHDITRSCEALVEAVRAIRARTG